MAALSISADGWHSVTAKLELRYRAPVPLDGQPLRIEAWRDATDERRAQKSRRVQKIHGRLLVADGSAAVEATGLFVRVDADSGDE